MVARFYRNWTEPSALYHFEVVVEQTDLSIACSEPLASLAHRAVREARAQVQSTIALQPAFATSLSPLEPDPRAAPLAQTMATAARAWSVGPMAAVAGAIAEYVGRQLASHAATVIVENGGDIFLLAREPLCLGLYAGSSSPFADHLTFTVHAPNGLGVCTSSGRVGPSLSFGKADAVVAIAETAAFADAAATCLANRIQTPDEVEPLVESERERNVLLALIACCGDRLAAWGDIELGKRRIERTRPLGGS